MLPISRALSNFLSYRDAAPTLHLDGVRLACLCGPNGHGKSALLDAIVGAVGQGANRNGAPRRNRGNLAPGNHDYYSPNSIYATQKWSPNVHVFRAYCFPTCAMMR